MKSDAAQMILEILGWKFNMKILCLRRSRVNASMMEDIRSLQ